MEEQLISSETAKLAKVKGFDELTPNLYVVDPDVRTATANNNGRTNSNYIERKDYKVYSRPTQSLLQKWLREEHNLHILMNVGMNDGVKQTFYCNIFKFGKNLYVGKFRSETSIYTYEEALEKGLIEALKLI